jgi:hypothetical protein
VAALEKAVAQTGKDTNFMRLERKKQVQLLEMLCNPCGGEAASSSSSDKARLKFAAWVGVDALFSLLEFEQELQAPSAEMCGLLATSIGWCALAMGAGDDAGSGIGKGKGNGRPTARGGRPRPMVSSVVSTDISKGRSNSGSSMSNSITGSASAVTLEALLASLGGGGGNSGSSGAGARKCSLSTSHVVPHLLRVLELSHGTLFKYNSGVPDLDPTTNPGLLRHLSVSTKLNPHDEGLVRVTSSAMGAGVASSIVSANGAPTPTYTSDGQPNPFVAVDLNGADGLGRLLVSHYTLRHGFSVRHGSDYAAMRSWVLQGSNLESPPAESTEGWDILDSRFHDERLGGDYNSATFEAANKGKGNGVAYRHFRIQMSGPNSSGDNRLSVCALELYGRVVQSTGVQQQRAACQLCLRLLHRLLSQGNDGAEVEGGAGNVVGAVYGYGGVQLLLDMVHDCPEYVCSIIATMLKAQAFGPDTLSRGDPQRQKQMLQLLCMSEGKIGASAGSLGEGGAEKVRAARTALKQAKQTFFSGLSLDVLMELSETPACLEDAQFHQLCIDAMILLSSTPCWAGPA